jgi:hypothetical protein
MARPRLFFTSSSVSLMLITTLVMFGFTSSARFHQRIAWS